MISPILFLAVAAWAIAQALKMLISVVVYRKVDWSYLFTGGGMPSSHSALVCACASGIGMTAGFDAANVRKETGEQAKILNYIMQNWNEHKPELFAEELKELIGHTPLQVAAGAILGVIVGTAGAYFLL